jgi:enoyl-CoA hydratase/carnithine racemase
MCLQGKISRLKTGNHTLNEVNMGFAIALEDRPGFYTPPACENIAVIRLGKDFLLELIEPAESNRWLDVFERMSKSSAIKVLVIINCREKIGSEQYIHFCRQTIRNEADRTSIHRMCNIFDQLIQTIVSLDKLVIYADCGEIIPLFLNIGLACDHRIVSDHTTFQKPYFELGMLPKGGAAFFLCRLLGYGKAKQLLMSRKAISASEAFEIGIVDQVVPHDKLEQTAIETAQDWTQPSTGALLRIKRLLNYTTKDLEDYLKFESEELLKAISVS